MCNGAFSATAATATAATAALDQARALAPTNLRMLFQVKTDIWMRLDRVNDSYIDATGSLPDVVPYTRKTYGGWPGDPSWMAAGCEIPYQAWKTSGDLTSLAAAYPECRALVEFMVRHVNPAVGLAEFGYCKFSDTFMSCVTSCFLT
jgi:hypothetical protein